MTKAVPKEGLRAPLFFGVITAITAITAITSALLLPSVASAQTVDRADLQRCAALSGAETKLACFEALANGEVPIANDEPPVDTDTPSPSAAAAAAGAAATVAAQDALSEPLAADVVSDIAADAEAENIAIVVEDTTDAPAAVGEQADALPDVDADARADSAATQQPPVDQPAAANAAAIAVFAASEQAVLQQSDADIAAALIAAEAHSALVAEQNVAAAAVATTSSVPDSFGAEHLDSDSASGDNAAENKKEVVATVDRVKRGYGERLSFYFDNGQVWRQSTADYIQYPKDEAFDVEISRGMMGDYRLRVGGEGRMTRIVRVK
jgi:hypothetical protein